MAKGGNRKERLALRPARFAKAQAVADLAEDSLEEGISNLRITAPSSTVASTVNSAITSATQSANVSDDDQEPQTKIQPFPFLLLPSEIRTRVYDLVFAPCPKVLDLDPTLFHVLLRWRILALFGVSRLIHNEASHRFFSTHAFRIFPTYPGKHFKAKRPMLARIPTRYRASIATLELRLGPGWNNPPRGWLINDALGLRDCESVRVLNVFVECDPSDTVFAGFRKSEDFYEKFSADLLTSILEEIPSIEVIEFDAWKSVNKTGGMMTSLRGAASCYDKVIAWGPERGWDKDRDQEWLDGAIVQVPLRPLNIAITVSG